MLTGGDPLPKAPCERCGGKTFQPAAGHRTTIVHVGGKSQLVEPRTLQAWWFCDNCGICVCCTAVVPSAENGRE